GGRSRGGRGWVGGGGRGPTRGGGGGGGPRAGSPPSGPRCPSAPPPPPISPPRSYFCAPTPAWSRRRRWWWTAAIRCKRRPRGSARSARGRLFQQQLRQPERQRRHVGHQREHDQHRHVEDQDAARYRLHAHAADRASDHHRRPDRRREQADAEIENHDDAEVHGVDAEGLDHGQEDWRADQQHRRQIHERAERQQQNVDVEQKRVFVARDRDEKLRDLRRYAHDRHHVAEGDREADHDHDHADGAHDARDQLRHLAPLDVAVDEHRDEEGVNTGDRSGFGRREDAGQDAAEDDRDRNHAPDRIDGDPNCLAQRYDLAFGELVAVS